ncbi:MAG TPA: tRNA (adenosine(37)-N6)-dimethylallyltransferase MiaA [Candidatus Limnocylindrales bacterium]|nr:tRNA (adenosine(37)-N6)-dimethylallyltransferase MiaA [Candidatus Limnocylindrales bacterium]
MLAGATGTGKTGLSIALAHALRSEGVAAEIISADSRQVYRGLDIGTAKATPAERADVPHHGLDLVDPDEPFSVADFVRHANDALRRIADGGGADGGGGADSARIALLVGGTGLYLRAVARGLDVEALPFDPAVRERVEAELREGGLEAAATRLARLAPTLAASTDVRNPRRVTRALEIAELVGDRPRPAGRGYPGPVTWLGLAVEPAVHREWLGARAREQFDAGLVDEARGLRERFDPSLPAFSAIGYAEAWAVLDGELSREEAIDRDARRNVAFARRQRTWFRSEPDIRWLRSDEDATTVLGQALDAARRLIG